MGLTLSPTIQPGKWEGEKRTWQNITLEPACTATIQNSPSNTEYKSRRSNSALMARNYPIIKSWCKIPGVGLISVTTISAMWKTGNKYDEKLV